MRTLRSLRTVNRATLARQGLLDRLSIAPVAAVGRFGWLQAQVTASPVLSLGARLEGLRREAVLAALHTRQLVRAPFLRNTMHIVPADDYLRFWPLVQPALARAFAGFFRPHQRAFDLPAALAATRTLLEERPRTTGELATALAARIPGAEGSALAYAIRTFLPVVQVPDPSAPWGFPAQPRYTLAESWLGRSVAAEGTLEELVRRYLAAFGPATRQDMQAWLGAPVSAAAFRSDALGLRPLRGPDGETLWDVADAPLPDEDVPAPPRLLPEFDPLLLAHADRARVIDPAYRKAVFLSAGRVRATILADGFVAGVWSVGRKKAQATLVLSPFRPLPPSVREALAAEAAGVLTLVAPEATPAVRFDDP